MTRLEVVVSSVEDAIAAVEGGAHSLEIAMELEAEGLTPPLWMVQEILDETQDDTQVHVLLRPHDEGFLYTPQEIDILLHDADMFASYSVDGVVFGAHTPEGALDFDLIRRAASAASGKVLTVHRALDRCLNPDAAIAALVDAGIKRVLISGSPTTAQAGRETLRQWVRQYGHTINIVAAGSITLENAADLARYTNVPMIHVGHAARSGGVVDAFKVRALVEALED